MASPCYRTAQARLFFVKYGDCNVLKSQLVVADSGPVTEGGRLLPDGPIRIRPRPLPPWTQIPPRNSELQTRNTEVEGSDRKFHRR